MQNYKVYRLPLVVVWFYFLYWFLFLLHYIQVTMPVSLKTQVQVNYFTEEKNDLSSKQVISAVVMIHVFCDGLV